MFQTIERILQDARAGKMFIILDDEHRENEGDVMIAAQYVTPQVINFILHNARGMMCMPLHHTIATRLELPMQHRRNVDDATSAFTVSISAKNAISTGISVFDRAHTIKVAIDANTTPDDIKTPGHIIPLIACPGGLNVRRGHTEASIEVMQLAGLIPAAVLCEILNEDGAVACRAEVMDFATKHQISVSTVENLVEYKNRTSM